MSDDKKLISIRKAVIIGLITGFVLMIISIGLGFIWEHTDLSNNIIMRVLYSISASFIGIAGLVALIADDILRIHNIVIVLLMFFGAQELLGTLSGILLATVSKKSRQLSTFWFGARAAIILMFIGMIMHLIFRVNAS